MAFTVVRRRLFDAQIVLICPRPAMANLLYETIFVAKYLATPTVTITHFIKQGGQLLGVGTVSGTITSATGTVLASLSSVAATIPIQSADPSCTILVLHTGAIHLDLLGLVIDLSPIDLTITAQQGPGNLLGNLLCAVANLLNGGEPLTALTGLLNRILSLLQHEREPTRPW